ncbi:MAG: class I SAM-dependent methyltransferase, partial [Frankia sp.]
GAYQALCVATDTLERAGLKAAQGLAPVDLAELTTRLKRYAPTSTGLAVLDGLATATGDRRGQRAADAAGWRAALLLLPPTPSPAALAVKRDEYAADLAAGSSPAAGTGRFFEPPRTTCPWCGAAALERRLRAVDLVQAKPGTFRYDRCRACAHVFQNPRLSPAGLEFYYRDFYDGLGEARMEALFGAGAGPYRSRAGLVARSAAPRTWLDVGGGHGHFCLIARETWPETRFDALDQGAGIVEAHRRGWVDDIYRGEFPALAGELAGRYDVVSMFHYLEHVRDPFAELDAAREVVRPGGHLVIEVPNIESLSASLVGQAWAGWLVPQHQHMIPMDNLLAALAERSFTPVTASFGDSLPGGPGGLAVYFHLNRWFPDPTLPWRPASHQKIRKVARGAAFAAAVPAMVAAAAGDLALTPLRRSGRRADVYRVVARRDA